MQWVLSLQNWVLNQSPSLLPALSIVYSLLSSVHCSIMCSAMLPEKTVEQYYIGRLISYTSLGFLLGGLGGVLLNSLELKLLSVLSFVVFAVLTLVILGYSGVYKIIFPKVNIRAYSRKGSFYRGLFSAFIPCHLLYFFYSLAVLSGTYLGGAIILFGVYLVNKSK